MSTFYKEFNADKCIVIPSIQREYVQPLNKSVIKGFVDALLRAYSTGEKKDLNYIYGLRSEASFEPIDGQQRLTTLWLLHLYVAARKGQILPIKLEYKTRDFSSDFCVKLRENAASILATSNNPSKDITNANWFIETWVENITVSSMLQALDEIHLSIKTSNTEINRLWDNMIKDDSPVTFAFKSTEDLGDDVYVKMNARGKSLSDFENLKSWLDDRLTELVKDERNDLDNDFLTKWRECIDNDWTDLFWRNRNRNDSYPEEIDDEQMRLFYNIAFILWAQKNKAERKKIIRDPSSIQAIASLLEVDENEVVDKIMERMRLSSVDLPLYILDKLDIFNDEFFIMAKKVLNGLIQYENEINHNIQALKEEEFSEKVSFGDLQDVKDISFMCQLLMSEKDKAVSYTKMTIVGALCYYLQNEANQTNLRDWLRFIRNIANNTNVNAETVHNVLSAFKKWALSCTTNKIEDVIKTVDDNTSGIDHKQINEEKYKANLFNRPNVIHAIRRLENHQFFFGRIGFLLKLLETIKPEDYNTTLINYANILYEFFGKEGPNFDSKGEKYLAHRVLLACSEFYGIGYYYQGSWCLFESKYEWKSIYLGEDGFQPDKGGKPRNIGISRMLEEIGTVENLTSTELKNILDKYKEKVSDWRRPLLDHSELWDYMGSNCLKFRNNYNILLIPGVRLRDSGHRSELRARSLYLDFKYSNCLKELCSPKEEDYFGWKLDFYDLGSGREDKNSYIFFEKENNGEKLVIEIYFDVEHAKKEEAEDSYCIELFVRENNRDNSELVARKESVWGDIVNFIHNAHTDNQKDNQGRYHIQHLSKQNVINLLKNNILQSR